MLGSSHTNYSQHIKSTTFFVILISHLYVPEICDHMKSCDISVFTHSYSYIHTHTCACTILPVFHVSCTKTKPVSQGSIGPSLLSTVSGNVLQSFVSHTVWDAKAHTNFHTQTLYTHMYMPWNFIPAWDSQAYQHRYLLVPHCSVLTSTLSFMMSKGSATELVLKRPAAQEIAQSSLTQ